MWSTDDTESGRTTGPRGVAPVVGVLALVLVTVTLALVVGTALPSPDIEESPSAGLSVTVVASEDRVALTHEGGDTLDVSAVTLQIEVDGTPLAEQPPVPFFAADGFESGPTGPFNSRSPDSWRAGETGSVRLATTNTPMVTPGLPVTVTLTTEGAVIYRETVTAR